MIICNGRDYHYCFRRCYLLSNTYPRIGQYHRDHHYSHSMFPVHSHPITTFLLPDSSFWGPLLPYLYLDFVACSNAWIGMMASATGSRTREKTVDARSRKKWTMLLLLCLWHRHYQSCIKRRNTVTKQRLADDEEETPPITYTGLTNTR